MNGSPLGAVCLDRASDEVTALVRTADSAAQEAANFFPLGGAQSVLEGVATTTRLRPVRLAS